MRWADVEKEVPELATRAKAFLDGHTHLTIATVRKDGSPRISGTEIQMRDGEIFIGSMNGAMKALDLQRDPRFALHSASEDPDKGWAGDAKLAGSAEEVDHDEDYHLFRFDITELVVVGLNEDRSKMVIESWHEGRGTNRVAR
ncbi:MAG: pyridoxamine 5'-phosphate oxidase family protein [Thermoleophilaceae bacterium]|nr:pyridoxamine 5'-phosphate oxidase family protein [Thermoleophilaceae bacterium]